VLNQLARAIDQNCQQKGFNDKFEINTALLLTHSEISEAMEELRSGKKVDELYFRESDNKPEGFPAEIADTIIRLLHIAARCRIDIDEVVSIKMKYNAGREFKHGKNF